MADINLHFTGDFAAIAAANNLLAALIDNHVHHGNELDIDVRSVTWKRVVDINDRALREIVVGLGGDANGYPREDGFDIVVASELMAIFCLTESWADLKRRIGDIVIGYTRGKQPVTARELQADGAMAVLLRDALAPEPGADPRARAGVRARRPVRQHRARLQLGDGHPGRPAAGRLRGHRGRLRRRPRRGEVRRHQVPQVRAATRRRGGGGDGARAEVPRRRRGGRPRTEDLAAVEAGMANLRRHLRQHPRGVRHPVRGRGQPVPDRHRRRGRRVVVLCARRGRAGVPGDALRRRRGGRGGPGQGRAGGCSTSRRRTRSPSPTTTSCR